MPTTCLYTVEKVSTSEAREEALQIRFDVFIKEQGVAPDIESDEFDDSATHWLVRNTEGVPVGTARMRDLGDRCVKLGRLAVLEPYRGQGVGRLIMTQMEAEALAQGFQTLVVHSQEYCVAFYQKQGFAVIDPTVFYEAELPHIAMKKSI